MKKLLITLFILSGPLFIIAQGGGAIKKGGMEVNAGTGFWSVSPVIMPIHGGMDFGITDDISVGFDVGWRLYNDGWGHSLFVFQARGDYHFNTLIGLDDKWDVYAGFQAGPGIMTAAINYPGTRKGFKVAVEGVAGGRWFFSKTIGLNAEVGLMSVLPDVVSPTAFMNFGVTFAIK